MPISDMIKDPATGKIKPAVLIGGAGIGIAGVFMLMSKGGGSSGTTSPGQSSDITDALAGLSDAILGLAGGSGAGGGTTTRQPGSSTTSGGTTSVPKAKPITTPSTSQPPLSVVKQGIATAAVSTAHPVGALTKTTTGLSSAPKIMSTIHPPTILHPATIAAGGARSYNAVRDSPGGNTYPTAPVRQTTTSSLKLTTTPKIAAKTTKPGMSGTHIGGGGPQQY